jgi:hypothetical protein
VLQVRTHPPTAALPQHDAPPAVRAARGCYCCCCSPHAAHPMFRFTPICFWYALSVCSITQTGGRAASGVAAAAAGGSADGGDGCCCCCWPTHLVCHLARLCGVARVEARATRKRPSKGEGEALQQKNWLGFRGGFLQMRGRRGAVKSQSCSLDPLTHKIEAAAGVWAAKFPCGGRRRLQPPLCRLPPLLPPCCPACWLYISAQHGLAQIELPRLCTATTAMGRMRSRTLRTPPHPGQGPPPPRHSHTLHNQCCPVLIYTRKTRRQGEGKPWRATARDYTRQGAWRGRLGSHQQLQMHGVDTLQPTCVEQKSTRLAHARTRRVCKRGLRSTHHTHVAAWCCT